MTDYSFILSLFAFGISCLLVGVSIPQISNYIQKWKDQKTLQTKGESHE